METIQAIALVIFVVGLLGGVLRTGANGTPKPEPGPTPRKVKYTVEVNITDPMVVSEIQTLKQLQDIYNTQIQQQREYMEIIQRKYDNIVNSIKDQYNEMEYTSSIGGDAKINRKLYESKIASLSESKNKLYGQILKVEEKICELTVQSDGITLKLDKIGHREYKRQKRM